MATFDHATKGRLGVARPTRTLSSQSLRRERSGRIQVREILSAPRPQAKLTVGPPGHAYEREADRVADAVQQTSGPGGSRIQRQEVPPELRTSVDLSKLPDVELQERYDSIAQALL